MPAFATLALGFGKKHLGLIGGVLASIVLGLMLMHSKAETRGAKAEAARWEVLFHTEQSSFRQTVANVRASTARAKADDAAHALQVEHDQEAKTQKVSTRYENDLAALRARYAAISRVQPGATKSGLGNPGSGGATPVPSVPDPSGRPDDTASYNCEADALQLEALQDWLREQEAVKR